MTLFSNNECFNCYNSRRTFIELWGFVKDNTQSIADWLVGMGQLKIFYNDYNWGFELRGETTVWDEASHVFAFFLGAKIF